MDALSDTTHDDSLPDIDDDFDVEFDDSGINDLPADRFLDRELSWLAFNQRVLELAEDAALPLLERVNFLAIFASNLDEFFMVRVAGLKRRIVTGLAVPNSVGRAPSDVLLDIGSRARELQERHARVFADLLKPELETAGITLTRWNQLTDDEQSRLSKYFSDQVFPVLMPLAVDPAHPFPYISGLSLNLAVRVRSSKTGTEEFARLKIPQMLPRFVRVNEGTDLSNVRFITLEDLIANRLDEVFPGMEIVEHHAFRVTRNEDVEIDEDETENLIQVL
ncbi:MAG: RNA degradosome polyphosphate kinase, partial [Microbacteriaceae bacterium]